MNLRWENKTKHKINFMLSTFWHVTIVLFFCFFKIRIFKDSFFCVLNVTSAASCEAGREQGKNEKMWGRVSHMKGEPDGKHMSALVCFLTLHTFTQYAISISPISPVAIGPSTPWAAHYNSTHCASWCVWGEWYTWGLCMSSSCNSLMFVYLFDAFKCFSGGIFNEVCCSVHMLNSHTQLCHLRAYWC